MILMTRRPASPAPISLEGETGTPLRLQESDDPEPSSADGRVDARPLVIDIVCDDADWSAFGAVEDAVTTAADAVASEPSLALADVEAVVPLSSDAEVGALNATYRGKAKPTNVLSFPAARSAFSPPGERRNLGDIVVARETVLREATDQELKPVHHLQHLVVHGVLHLLGFDHLNGHDAEVMEALEVRILARLGIADPYGDAPLETQGEHTN
jgi:probable rRNA maturation factor